MFIYTLYFLIAEVFNTQVRNFKIEKIKSLRNWEIRIFLDLRITTTISFENFISKFYTLCFLIFKVFHFDGTFYLRSFNQININKLSKSFKIHNYCNNGISTISNIWDFIILNSLSCPI